MWNKASVPTLVSEGTRIRGEVAFVSQAEISGIIEGDCIQYSTDLVHVEKTGWVHGSIEAKGDIFVDGRVEGSLCSQSKITLSRSAIVQGTLRAPKIEIQPGATLQGRLWMQSNTNPI